MRPVGKDTPKMSVIERYKDLGLALDILYRVPGYLAEPRRITPLFVEERGEQRTFRLDRIEVSGT